MARMSKEYLNELKRKLGVETLYSWSRYNCYKTSPYEYLLKYIKREKETRQSIYAPLGSVAHDIIEDLYEGKVEYEDMIDIYNDSLDEFDIVGLKFDRSDEDKNKAIEDKYRACMRHFFENHKVIKENIALEKFVTIDIEGKFYMIGYIDAVYKDSDGYYSVVDWKSSSLYRGQKADKEKGQLVLYALALNQMGVPLDKIKICWNFLKYTDVTFVQKNGKKKTMTCERHEIVKKLKSRLLGNLRDNGYDELDAQMLLAECIDDNSLSKLPQDIQDLYTFEDCYVYPTLNQTEIDMLVDDIYETLDYIETLTSAYKESGNDELFWDAPESVAKQSYYFANLCGYSAQQHKPYREYLENNQMYKKEEEKVDYDGSSLSEEDNDDWMKELGLE